MSYVTGRSMPPARPLPGPPETLPTMYDLPSEFPEEPGLPDVGVSPSRDYFMTCNRSCSVGLFLWPTIVVKTGLPALT